jgi:lipopolysaccharide export system permease protein
MVPLVDRYLILEVIKTFLAIVLTLMLILVSMLFLRTLEQVNLGALNIDLVLRHLGLQLQTSGSSVLPPAFFITVLATLGRLAKDSELIALNACGIGPGRVYRALLVLAVPVAAVTGWFALVLQPAAVTDILELRLQQKEQAAQVAGLQAGRFYLQENGELVVYVGEIRDREGLQRVFILDRREGVARVVVSASGRHGRDPASEDHLVTLVDGHRFDGKPGEAAFLIASFDEYQVRIRSREPEQPTISKRSAAPTSSLIGTGELADRAELERRFGAAGSIFVLALMAVPLVALSPRQSTTGRLFIAFLAYFAFFNLQRLADSWLSGGTTPPWLGSLWYQPLVLGLVYLMLVPDSLWFRRLRRRLSGDSAARPIAETAPPG